jgi:hypothetical protein
LVIALAIEAQISSSTNAFSDAESVALVGRWKVSAATKLKEALPSTRTKGQR